MSKKKTTRLLNLSNSDYFLTYYFIYFDHTYSVSMLLCH